MTTTPRTYSFDAYFTGSPLKKMVYSYNATTMTESFGRTRKTVDITPEQFHELHGMQANDWIAAASIFGDAEANR